MMTKQKLTLTTDAGGAATATTNRPLNGELYGIYVDQGDLATTVDITVTQNDGQGQLPVVTITNQSASTWYHPIITATHFSGSGTPKTDGMMPIVGYVTITLAEGGATKTGTAYILVEE
jgi:hypothetical protein